MRMLYITILSLSLMFSSHTLAEGLSIAFVGNAAHSHMSSDTMALEHDGATLFGYSLPTTDSKHGHETSSGADHDECCCIGAAGCVAALMLTPALSVPETIRLPRTSRQHLPRPQDFFFIFHPPKA